MALPAILALATAQPGECSRGLGLGLMGSLKNTGKVLGPLLTGPMIHLLGFNKALLLLVIIFVSCLFLFRGLLFPKGPTPSGSVQKTRPDLPLEPAQKRSAVHRATAHNK